jgi:hypothetical protein
LKRTFAVDVLVCAECQGPMRILAFIDEPSIAVRVLEHLGLPSAPVRPAAARGPPQRELDFDAA